MSCYGSLGEPVPCGGFNIYNSYVTDPLYQNYFTAAWGGLLTLAFLATVPSIYAFLRSGRWREGGVFGFFGLHESWSTQGYNQIDDVTSTTAYSPSKRSKFALGLVAITNTITRSTLPLPSFVSRIPYIGKAKSDRSCHTSRPLLPFSFGQLFLALLIPVFILSTIFSQSELVANPNRFGFIALACLPPLFLLSTKSGPVVWLTSEGWTAVNFLHRWLGRSIVLLVFLHAYFWTAQWISSGQVALFLSQDKEVRGIAAFSFLLLIAVSSIRPIRRYSYSIFFVLHYVGIIGFLVYVNKHTVYAQGWATYSIVGIYVVDIVGRLSSLRIRYVEVEALEGGMVRVGMPGVTSGWRGGQHLSLRLFFVPPSLRISSGARLFEAHPFSIATAPPPVGVLNSLGDNSAPRGVELFIRSCGVGSWTGDLLETALIAADVARNCQTDGSQKKQILHMLALVEGPHGGIGPYAMFGQENILLVAGGSGMSFTMGLLDEIVGRRIKNGAGGKISVVWAVRERAHVAWYSEQLRKIIDAASRSNLAISVRIYITCDPTLTAITPTPAQSISNDETEERPLSHTMLIYSRPLLSQLVKDTVGAALAPCGRCWPVCYCGDASNGGDGVCVNDEEECCTSPGNGRDQLVDDAGDSEKKLSESEKEIEELPSCCGKQAAESMEDIILASTMPKTGCCATESSAKKPETDGCGGCCARTGAECCSGGIEGALERTPSGPLRIRTGGLGVAVCGPGSMISELRAAVAAVPIAKQVRIGGIDLHCEGFSI